MGREEKPSAAILPFRSLSARGPRRAPILGEARGAILLFTGVRYERQPECGPTPSDPPFSAGRPGGRRRRS